MNRSSRIASVPHNGLPSHTTPTNSNIRRQSRKPSITEVFLNYHEPPQTSHPSLSGLATSSSFRNDYSNLPDTKARLAKATKLLNKFLEPYEEFYEDEEGCLTKEDINKFMAKHKAMGLTDAECNELTTEVIVSFFKDRVSVDNSKMMKTFFKTLLSYADFTTDVMVFVDLLKKVDRVFRVLAIAQGVSIGFSLLCQCVISLAFGQPLWVGLAGLIGLKPLIEGWRDAVGSKPFPNQKVNNEMMLALTRITEITTESTPQSIIQTILFLLIPANERTTLLYASLFSSFFTTAITVAFADKEIDTSKFRRKDEPLLFGYIAGKHYATKQLCYSVIFFTFYAVAKTFSFAILFISAPSKIYSLGWLVLEYLGFLLWRMSYGSWRVYRNGADGTIFSLLIHLGCYLCLLSAPFPMIRIPSFLTPRIYSRGLIYMLVVNFVMVAVSFHIFNGGNSNDLNGTLQPDHLNTIEYNTTSLNDPQLFNTANNTDTATLYLSEPVAWLGLSIATAICLISGGMFFSYVPQSHRNTFYKQLTFKEHLATYYWNDKTADRDHNNREVDTNEAVRALLPTWCSEHYLPKEKLIELYKTHWADWVDDPPEWFDADFRAMIPRELLVEVNPMLWEEAEVES